MYFTIHGYSTALFSTWFFIEELGILLDAGDGVSAHLLQKARKINHTFITHPDRDHLTGLLQFNQLNAREGFPKIYYPKDSGSFPALESFTKSFDPHIKGTEWIPIGNKEIISVSNTIEVESMRNNHVQAPIEIIKSLSYKIVEIKSKLKPEFQNLSSNEIMELSAKHGKDFLSQRVRTNILTYAGDTPVDDYSKYDGSKILMHEATFINDEHAERAHGNKHSQLKEVIKMASEINIEHLILHHFSSRYNAEYIFDSIEKECKKYQIKTTISVFLPGKYNCLEVSI